MSDETYNVRQPATPPAQEPGPGEDRVPTIRTTPVDADAEALPDQAAQYVGPQAAPKISEHKTIDMVPVRLAPEVDPRRALTRRLETPSDGGTARTLLLAAGVVCLVLAAIIGVMRWLRPAGSDTASVDGVAPVAAPSVAVEQPAVPAAAALTVPTESGPVDSEATTAPAPADERPASSATPANKTSAKPAQKGKQLWLE